jgi:hypothetical protein
MIFKQGKFYNTEGERVALEHGNKEQIEILNKVEALRDGVLHFPGDTFTCLCGLCWHPLFEDGKKIKCNECNQKYEFFLFDDEIPCIKMITER